MSKKKLYWVCQLAGWFVYVLLNLLFFVLQNPIDLSDLLIYTAWVPLGIGITHLFRTVFIWLHIMQLKLYIQIPLVIIGSFVNATLFYFGQYLLELVIHHASSQIVFIDSIANIINYAFVFFFWSLAYFSYHFLINYTQAEMESLRWQANIKEIELNKLKSQLNPHFMFNSMNSIRALVDENPSKAKEAITQLSNILRNTLMMEKNKVIPFQEELSIVNDYLNLEKVRFEERLNFKMNISSAAYAFSVPPLLIQTLVENGIKHGISKLTKGGEILIDASVENGLLQIVIKNTGSYDESHVSETGFGLKNSKDRLQYVFGESADISIRNGENNFVITELRFPKYSSI
ncbi:MAG: lytS [Bacteroidetes bacterium]|jgi:sensor histidine kinase YesM|nr:lytS [Bacteroidota bacterium]